jgi:hypothetical protein
VLSTQGWVFTFDWGQGGGVTVASLTAQLLAVLHEDLTDCRGGGGQSEQCGLKVEQQLGEGLLELRPRNFFAALLLSDSGASLDGLCAVRGRLWGGGPRTKTRRSSVTNLIASCVAVRQPWHSRALTLYSAIAPDSLEDLLNVLLQLSVPTRVARHVANSSKSPLTSTQISNINSL